MTQKRIRLGAILVLSFSIIGAAACTSSSGGARDATGADDTAGPAGAGGSGGVGTGGITDSGGIIGSGGVGDDAAIADTGRRREGGPPFDLLGRPDYGEGGFFFGGGGGTSGAGGRTGPGGRSGTGGDVGADAGATGGISGSGGNSGAGGNTVGTCLGSGLLASLGKDTVLVGGSMDDATAGKAPFDGRYLYLSGGLFDGSSPCSSCDRGCTAEGDSCANSGSGCAWWGCWQWDQDPPGQYVRGFVDDNESASPKQIPMFTYYEELQTSGLPEGTEQVAAINDAAFLTRYLADWRFVLEQIGTHAALLHIEPDFWGYVEQLNSDPHKIPAKVMAANATDCESYEDSAAGLAGCMIHMVRLYAPNAKVGLHASAWGTKMDVFGNSDPKLDVVGEAQKMVAFLTDLGAKDGDFIVIDAADRDAGYYEKTQGRDTWWDATNATLPNFHQAFTWTKAVAEGLGLPVIYWQLPVGNMSLDDTYLQYKDNRLDYFFAHTDEVVAAHVVGLFFGAGADGPTTPETDGGNFVAKTSAYRSAGGTKICP